MPNNDPNNDKDNLYDQFPYPSTLCYAQTHPNRMASIATVLGLAPPPVKTCRVLELGCAGGGNIIPMAANMPEATFVGIDYTAGHIEEAKRMAKLFGLENIRFEHLDIMDIDADFGTFDYIIVHGIYSWVPEPVREHILTVCNQNLVENGIAYISYNAYPGWHIFDATRTMMMYHTRNIKDPKRKVTEAQRLMNFLASTQEDTKPDYGNSLQAFIAGFQGRWEYYKVQGGTLLLHDDLGEFNQPFYFYEFIADAERHGLQFLSEANLADSMPRNFPKPITNVLNAMADDAVEMEQYMDFLRSRPFRRTLLCKQSAKIQRDIKPSRTLIQPFKISTWAAAEDDPDELDETDRATFKTHSDLSITTDHPVSKAALFYLTEISPHSVAFDDLLTEARIRVYDNPEGTDALDEKGQPVNEDDADTLATTLITGFTGSDHLVELNLHMPAFALQVSEKPATTPLIRYYAEQGVQAIPNLRHERVEIDLIHTRILPLLDGEHDREALLAAMQDMVEDGLMEMEDEGEALRDDPKRMHNVLELGLDESLERLARTALLVG